MQARAKIDRMVLGTAGIVLVAVLAAYCNSFFGPFVFDDSPSITDNPTICHLWPIGPALSPPSGGLTVSGRPVVNLSLAINYAMGGLKVWGYHAVNVGIHVLAALTLFGIVRRTLGRVGKVGHLTGSHSPTLLALAVAMLWALHPLQTESVTYVIQRAESLMGLFYLFTLYCFVRGSEIQVETTTRTRWYALSVAACFLGMATKEVMVTAPLMVFLYDRTFAAGSFMEAWRRRRGFYLCLASAWLLLSYLMIGAGSRAGTVGYNIYVPWWDYALSQIHAVVHYLRLSIWPRPLVIDYGPKAGASPAELARDATVIALFATVTMISIWRHAALGFLGLWFFVVIAPSSSVVPIVTEKVAEHRMYLPLAAVAVLGVVALNFAVERFWPKGVRSLSPASACALMSLIPAVLLGFVTARRNDDYRSSLALWSQTVQNKPDNPNARNNLGNALLEAGRVQEAIDQFTAAVRISPDFAGARYNLANALLRCGRVSEALAQCEEALQLRPDSADIRDTLGHVLAQAGRLPEAITQFKQVLRLKPESANAHRNLGTVYLRAGRESEAMAEYERALNLTPDDPESHANVGFVLARGGRAAEAVAEYEEALRLKPDLIDARVNLGTFLLSEGRVTEAMAQFQAALRFKPDCAAAHFDLGLTFLALGRTKEADTEFETATRLGRKK